MNKSSSLKTVTLLPAVKSNATTSKTKSKTILPAIKFINADGAPAIMQLKDGDYRQVLQISGINLIDAQQFGQELEEQFKALLDSTDCHIQILIASRPFPIGSRKHLLEQEPSPNPYFAWYADYLFKWFSRVAEVTCLPKLHFYLVLTVPAKLIKAKSASGILKAINDHTTEIVGHLEAMRQNPRLLDREQVRTLISQTFINPAIDSEQDTADEIPECASTSTIDEPSYEVKRDRLIVGNLTHNTCMLSQMPTRVWWGWLLDLICQGKPFTLSLHLRSCDQGQLKRQIKQANLSTQKLKSLQTLLDGKSKAIDVSLYLSTYSDAHSTANLHLSEYKRALNQRKAIATTSLGKQDLAWRACLPLGLDEVRQTSRVLTEIAAASWPAYTVVPEQSIGLPFGFGLASREPYFIDLSDAEHYLLAASEQADLTATATVLALRYLSLNQHVIYVGASESSGNLSRIIGPELSYNVDLQASVDQKSRSQSDAGEQAASQDKPFCYIDIGKLPSTYNASLVVEQIKQLSSGHNPRIIIEDTSLFLSSAEGTSAFTALLKMSSQKSCQIIAAVRADNLPKAPALWSQFKNQIILGPAAPDKAAMFKYLHLDENIHFYDDDGICLMVNRTTRSMLRIVYTPMEVGIVLRGHGTTSPATQLEQLREGIHQEIVKKNPNLSNTDAWRQTIYYFGLRANES